LANAGGITLVNIGSNPNSHQNLSPFLFRTSLSLWNAKTLSKQEEKTMANKSLFNTITGMFTPKADTVNKAGGMAYELKPKAALAQYAATGCFNQIFYAGADEQLEKVLNFARKLMLSLLGRPQFSHAENLL
jgi:hypothetical protein